MSFLIRRKIEIDAGHRVPTTDSKCKNVHGHRYVIEAVLRTEDVVQEGVEAGMVRDFGIVKATMMRDIHDKFDHKLILWKDDVHARALIDVLGPEGIVLVPTIPTAENLARVWFDRLARSLPALVAVNVRETPNATATYSMLPTTA